MDLTFSAAEEEFRGRIDNVIEVPTRAGVMERVPGVFVFKQQTVVASMRHRVPEPANLADRRNLVVRPMLNQRWRIPGPHKFDRRIRHQPPRGNASDLRNGLLFLWRVGEQIDHRVQGHHGRDARLRRRKGPVRGDHRGDQRQMSASRTAT